MLPIKQNMRRYLGLSYVPIFAKIEITRRCNLDCEMCVRKNLGEENDMTLQQFQTIIDKTDFVRVAPHGYGEPLVHPKFYEMMKYCHDKGVRTKLVTNGTMFTPDTADKYFSLNPDSVAFSFDSPVKAEYESIRRGADFDSVVKNIKYASENSHGVEIKVHMTVNKKNYRSIPEMKRFCRKYGLGLEIADVTYMYDFGTSTRNMSVREKLEDGKYSKRYRRCYLPWLSTYIDVEGNVFPCTDNLNWNLGSIYRKSMREIYNSEKMKKFRMASVLGLNDNCVKCSAWACGKCPVIKRFIKKKLGMGK